MAKKEQNGTNTVEMVQGQLIVTFGCNCAHHLFIIHWAASLAYSPLYSGLSDEGETPTFFSEIKEKIYFQMFLIFFCQLYSCAQQKTFLLNHCEFFICYSAKNLTYNT